MPARRLFQTLVIILINLQLPASNHVKLKLPQLRHAIALPVVHDLPVYAVLSKRSHGLALPPVVFDDVVVCHVAI